MTKIKEATGEVYQTAFLQKQVKELEANGGLAALPNASEMVDGEGCGSSEEVKEEESGDGDEEAIAT